jgi:uncharacterized protein (UPF0335 family)
MVRKLSEAMGDNGPPVADHTIVQACLAEYTELDSEGKRIAQKISSMFRRYEGQGINVKSIKATHRASKQDKAVAAAQARSDMQYMFACGVLRLADAEWARSVVQADLFGDAEPEEIGRPSEQLAAARAYSDGYNTGRHGGETGQNPHPPGMREHVAWIEGNKDGLHDRNLNPNTRKGRQADAEPKRPVGRPRGSTKQREAAAAEASAAA